MFLGCQNYVWQDTFIQSHIHCVKAKCFICSCISWASSSWPWHCLVPCSTAEIILQSLAPTLIKLSWSRSSGLLGSYRQVSLIKDGAKLCSKVDLELRTFALLLGVQEIKFSWLNVNLYIVKHWRDCGCLDSFSFYSQRHLNSLICQMLLSEVTFKTIQVMPINHNSTEY